MNLISFKSYDQRDIENTYDGYIKLIIQTPRDINRLFVHIDLFASKNELNSVDFHNLLMIEAIRIGMNNVYEQVKANKGVLADRDILTDDECFYIKHKCMGEGYLKETIEKGDTQKTRALVRIINLASVEKITIV